MQVAFYCAFDSIARTYVYNIKWRLDFTREINLKWKRHSTFKNVEQYPARKTILIIKQQKK